MRTLLMVVTSLTLLSACGRGVPYEEDALVDQQQAQKLVGDYTFGPVVGKGLPDANGAVHSTARLASLTLEPDGSFDMDYMMGCVGGFASGTWAVNAAGAVQLTLDDSGSWTDVNGASLLVSALNATRVENRLLIVGQTKQGRSFSQSWEQVAP